MHTLVALEDGRVFACGYGGGGGLGNASEYTGPLPLGEGGGSEPQARYSQQDVAMPVQGGLRVR